MIYDEQVVFNAETRFNVLPKRLVDSFEKLTTTPDVSNIEVFRTLNTTGTTVTNFLKGASGQSIRIRGDGFTTVENNTNIKTSTGAAKLLSPNLMYEFTNIDDVWYELELGSGGGGGGGSGSISYPYVHTGSSTSPAFTIVNTNVASFGLKILSVGTNQWDERYAFSVKSGDDSKRVVTVYADDKNLTLGDLPPAVQWPRQGNPMPDVASGGPISRVAVPVGMSHFSTGSNQFLYVANVSINGTATGGTNQQAIGMSGLSQGKIKTTMLDVGGDGGYRVIQNYVPFPEYTGPGTVSQNGTTVTFSVANAVPPRVAVWVAGNGVYLVSQIDAFNFVGNDTDNFGGAPGVNYAYTVTGAFQPDKYRQGGKFGLDSIGTFGHRIDPPTNANWVDPAGYTTGGDFLLRLDHNLDDTNGISRNSSFFTYNEGRGIDFRTSKGQRGEGYYADMAKVLEITAGNAGGVGAVNYYGALNNASDANLKKDIEGMESMLPILDAVRPVRFNWKEGAVPIEKEFGFIAQEIEAILPKLVSSSADVKTLNTISMIPILWKIVQELKEKVDSL